jgi:RNA polymerase sigma factor (sigma-70 family)
MGRDTMDNDLPLPCVEDLSTWDQFNRIVNVWLRPIALGMSLPSSQIEDVMQDVWVAALEYSNRYGKASIQQLDCWMRKVMQNKTVDALRHPNRETVLLEVFAIEQSALETEEAGIARQQEREWLKEQLAALAENESLNARLLRGRFVDGLTNAELARRNALTEKAVECRICRMISMLRRRAATHGIGKR